MGSQIFLGLFGPEGELSGKGYQRIELGKFQITESYDGTRTAKNLAQVEFPLTTEDWGLVTGFGIFDIQNALLFRGQLERPVTVLTGTHLVLTVGNLSVTWPSILNVILPPDKPKTLWERLTED